MSFKQKQKWFFFLSFKSEERLFSKSGWVSATDRGEMGVTGKLLFIHIVVKTNCTFSFWSAFPNWIRRFLNRASCGEKTIAETEQHCVYKLKPLFVILQHNSSDVFHSLNGKARCSVISLHAATWQTERGKGKTQQLSHSTNTSSNLGVKRNLAWCSYTCAHVCVFHFTWRTNESVKA